MKDERKTKKQLISELEELRNSVSSLEAENAKLRRSGNSANSEGDTFKNIFMAGPDNIIITRLHDGKVIDLNERFAEVTGYSRETCLGKKMDELNIWVNLEDREKFVKILEEEGEVNDFEVNFIDNDGSVSLYNLSARLMEIEGETCIVSVSRDITERKRTDELFKLIFDKGPIGMSVLDSDNNVIMANLALCEMMGYTAEEIKKVPIEDATHPEDFAKEKKLVQKMLNKEIPGFKIEKRYINKSGEIIWGELTALVIRNQVGEYLYGLGMVNNINDRKCAEESMREREELLRAITESAEDSIFCKDTESKYTFVNPAMERLLGLAASEIIGKTPVEIFGEEGASVISEVDEIAFNGQIADKVRSLIISGNTYYFHTVQVPLYNKDGDIVGICGIVRDITERKITEQELSDNRELYRLLAENTSDIIWTVDTDLNFTYISPSVTKLLGYTPEETIGKKIYEYLAPEDWDVAKELSARAFERLGDKGGKPFELKTQEWEQERKDGTRVWTEIGGKFLFDDDGKLLGLIGITRDITDRKKAQEELIDSEERFRSLSEASMEGVAITEKGLFIDANDTFLRLYGCEMEDVLGKSPMEFVAPECRELVEKNIKEGHEEPYETIGLRQDGSTFPLEVCGRASPYKGKMVRVSVIRDISRRKRAEEELLKAEKLASVSVLAGGIAHDFNNILTGIMGNITLASLFVEQDSRVSKVLSASEKACSRAKDLTQQLLTFAKGGAPIRETISIGPVIKETCIFSLHGSNVRCEFSIPEDLWMVEADEGQLNQVFNNIIINADQAMPDGGIIYIKAENIINNNEFKHGGKFVRISIKDQGQGIKKDLLQKIFDPYFTTKQAGTGLGLATCYSIIERHGGNITVESEHGRGTTFHINLPASESQVSQEDTDEMVIFGKGSVLVMDDEAQVREALGDMLQYLGYEVEFASNGREAIDMYEKAARSKNAFNAMILDLTVPGGMGGKECLTRLLKTDPDVKAIVSSGYSTDTVMANFREYGFSGVLSKPYKISDLSREMQKVINDGNKKY